MHSLPTEADPLSTLTLVYPAVLDRAHLATYQNQLSVYLQSVRKTVWDGAQVQFEALVFPLHNNRYILPEQAETAQALLYLYLQHHRIPIAISQERLTVVLARLDAIEDPAGTVAELEQGIAKHGERSRLMQEQDARRQASQDRQKQEARAPLPEEPAPKQPARRPAPTLRTMRLRGVAAALVLLGIGGYWAWRFLEARGRVMDVRQFAQVLPLTEARVIDGDHLYVVTRDDEFAKLARPQQDELGSRLLKQVDAQNLRSATIHSGGRFFQIYAPETARAALDDER